MLVEYEVSDRTSRFGYVRRSELPSSVTWKYNISSIDMPVTVTQDTFLTDDPNVSQYRQMTLKAGGSVRLLALYGAWYAYVETTLEGMDLGPLLGLWLQSSVIGLTMQIMGIIIFVLVYGRMIEIYLMTSLAPLPVATLSNRELGGTGQNYLKSLFAVGFQGMLILVCVAIYAVLVQGIATGGDPIGAIWGTVGYTVLLCFMLFKTGGIAQRIFGAH